VDLQRFVHKLLPKDDKFFVLLEAQAEVLGVAAMAMARFPENGEPSQVALERIHEVEHRGNDLAHAVVLGLDKTYITAIDREDIHNLSTALDKVLNYLYGAAESFVAYQVRYYSPAMRELIQICSEAVLVLKDAVPLIRRRHLDSLVPARQQLCELEKRGEVVYQTEMAALYKDAELNAKELLRQQAVLDSLEAALGSCHAAANVLENVAVKHS